MTVGVQAKAVPVPARRALVSVRTANWLLWGGVVVLLLSMGDPVQANVLDNFGTALLGIMNSTFLRAVAILAIIGAGLLALSGRIQWTSFLIIMLGVVIIFGAAGIVDYIIANAGTGTV